MSYNNDRIRRKKNLLFLNKIKIKISSFDFYDLTIIIGLLLIIFSAFIPWFILPYGEITQGIFSKLNGIVGYVSILLIVINIFILFSVQKKEKIRLYLNNKIQDNNILLFSAIIFLILGINSLITIKGLNIINDNIRYQSGLTFYIIASILFFVGVLLKIKKKNKENFISINESNKKDKIKNKKQNVMKLPFE